MTKNDLKRILNRPFKKVTFFAFPMFFQGSQKHVVIKILFYGLVCYNCKFDIHSIVRLSVYVYRSIFMERLSLRDRI